MEITGVETIPVEIGIKPESEPGGIAPYVGSRTAHEEMQRILVRVDTDEGITGWGELHTQPSIPAVRAIVETAIAPAIVGESVAQIGSIRDSLTGVYTHYTNIASYLGGVEIALWDALGKYHGVPVHRFFGGRRTETVEFAYCLGLMDEDRSRVHARRARSMGFEVLKTKAGTDWRADICRLEAMHEAVDGSLEFRLDPNQAWSCDETVRVAGRLENDDIFLQYLEQPIRIDSFGSLRQLRARLRTPIAINEDTYHPHNLYRAIKGDAIDVAVVDLVMLGGVLALHETAAIASEAGVSLAHHSSFDLGIKTAAKLHAISSSPGFDLPSDTVYYAWEDDVVESPFELHDGQISVPDGPGLGVSIDDEKIERYKIE